MPDQNDDALYPTDGFDPRPDQHPPHDHTIHATSSVTVVERCKSRLRCIMAEGHKGLCYHAIDEEG